MGCIGLNLARPLTLLIIGANAAAFIFVVESLHTIVVNRRFLPRGLQAPLWREAVLVFCALFYGAFFTIAMIRLL